MTLAEGRIKGKIAVINGSPTDNNAGQFEKGTHTILVGKEYDTPQVTPSSAQQ